MDKKILARDLERHEGRVKHAYQDSKGYWTIGVGHLIDERLGGGLPDHIIDLLLQHDIDEKLTEIRNNFRWFAQLSENRQRVIVNLCFNMGVPRFKKFKKTISYIESGQYDKVPDELRDSKWYREDVSTTRSEELIALWIIG